MHIHHRFSALRAVILGSLTITATLVAPVVSGSASGATQQFTLLEHSGQQTTSQYWEPTLNQRTDYTTPINYAEGRVYIKLDVLQKPSAKPVVAQLCMWRHTESTRFKFETCARTTKTNLTFTEKGTYYHDAGEPAAWYKKNGVWDWTRQASLGRIMLKDSATRKLLMSDRCGAACYTGSDLDDHAPIKFSAEVIWVAKGSTLAPPADWRSGCPASWSSQCQAGPATTTTTTVPVTTPPTTAPTTTTPTTVPATTAPAGGSSLQPTVVSGNRSLTVSWPAVKRAKQYQVRYSLKKGGYRWLEPSRARTATINKLTNGRTVTIQVRALVRTTWSDWVQTSGTPGA